MYKRNIEARSRNYCCRWKAISIIHFECVPVASDIQHAKCMRHTTLSSVTRLTVRYTCISTLSHKRPDFREKAIEYKIRVLIFAITVVWNSSHSKNWARYYQKSIFVIKCLFFLSHFHETWIFATDFRKNAQIPNFIQSRQVEAE